MNAMLCRAAKAREVLQALGHPLDLFIRLYVAWVFFKSGLAKIRNWEGTLFLFEEEYKVPLLDPQLAAWLGTAGELVLPPLLAFGLATRFAALSLSFVNGVAVVSYYHVLSKTDAALMSHFYWALLLAVPLCYGPGRLSLDHWLFKRLRLQSRKVPG